MKRLITLLILGTFSLSCNTQEDSTTSNFQKEQRRTTSHEEYVKISRDFISAMSQENPENLEKLFPTMDFSNFKYSSASTYISGVKDKFENESGLNDWGQIEAKGYLINADMKILDVVAEDINGNQFILNGLAFKENDNVMSFEIWDNDIYTLESFQKQGGKLDEIIWF